MLKMIFCIHLAITTIVCNVNLRCLWSTLYCVAFTKEAHAQMMNDGLAFKQAPGPVTSEPNSPYQPDFTHSSIVRRTPALNTHSSCFRFINLQT